MVRSMTASENIYKKNPGYAKKKKFINKYFYIKKINVTLNEFM